MGGGLCDLVAQCQWILKTLDNLRLPPKLRETDFDFFEYICGCTKIWIPCEFEYYKVTNK